MQIVYAPTGGVLVLMNGQTLTKAFVPLPAGATAVYAGVSLSYYRHADWLGSSRFASTPTTRTKYYSAAYAPFGEPYAESGTTDRSFTGQHQDTTADLYDFMFREYNYTHGRWISPDPVAGSILNPQSLNRYSYVLNNPANLIDPLGLQHEPHFQDVVTPRGGGSCYVDQIRTPCVVAFRLLMAGVAVNVTGIDTSPRFNNDQWELFGCFADGSCGFVPSSLTGRSPLDIASFLLRAASVGDPVAASGLTGSAADIYDWLESIGVSPSDITAYRDDAGNITFGLSQAALGLVKNSLRSHFGDSLVMSIFHPGFDSAARAADKKNSLHVVWTDPRLSTYFGVPGVFMQGHYDPHNPYGGWGSFWLHQRDVFFGGGP